MSPSSVIPATEPSGRRVRPEVPRLALSIDEACASIGVTRPTLYKLIASAQLRTCTVGRRRLVPVSELERFLAETATR